MTDPSATESTIWGDRYAVYDEIASGGMAIVFLAACLDPTSPAKVVAIKRLLAHHAKDPDFVRMFVDEARVAMRVRHRNVVTTHECIDIPGSLALVMDYVAGDSVADIARTQALRRERVPLPVIGAIVHGALLGLHAAHEARDEFGRNLGVIHRDVTPQNVLVGLDGVARVIDFGIARATGRIQQTESGVVKGKFAYMSPEQLSGAPLTLKSDVYGMGTVLWELLTGRRLFMSDNDHELIVKRALGAAAEPPSTVMPEYRGLIDEVVMGALAPSPDARYSTAAHMADAVGAALGRASEADVAYWVTRLATPGLLDRERKRALLEASFGGTLVNRSGVRALEDLRPVEPTAPASSARPAEPPRRPSGLFSTTPVEPTRVGFVRPAPARMSVPGLPVELPPTRAPAPSLPAFAPPAARASSPGFAAPRLSAHDLPLVSPPSPPPPPSSHQLATEPRGSPVAIPPLPPPSRRSSYDFPIAAPPSSSPQPLAQAPASGPALPSRASAPALPRMRPSSPALPAQRASAPALEPPRARMSSLPDDLFDVVRPVPLPDPGDAPWSSMAPGGVDARIAQEPAPPSRPGYYVQPGAGSDLSAHPAAPTAPPPPAVTAPAAPPAPASTTPLWRRIRLDDVDWRYWSVRAGVAALALLVVTGAYFAARAWERASFVSAAEERGIAVEVGGVSLGLSGATFHGLKASLVDDPDVTLRAEEASLVADARGARVVVPTFEVAVRGNLGAVADHLAAWRARVRADGALRVEARDGSLTWTGLLGQATLESPHVSLRMGDAEEDDIEAHVQAIQVHLPRGTLGPWDATVERGASRFEAVVALAPSAGDARHAKVTVDARLGTIVEVDVPAAPLSLVGIPESVLGAPSGAWMSLSTTALLLPSSRSLEAHWKLALETAPAAGRAPIASFEGRASGDPAKAIDIQHGQLAVAGVPKAIHGTVEVGWDGVAVELAEDIPKGLRPAPEWSVDSRKWTAP